MRIRRLGVVGAGTMGGGIAALAASAGIPVVLLDIPATEWRPKRNRAGRPRAGRKSKPAAFMDVDRARGNRDRQHRRRSRQARRAATSSSRRSSNSSSRSARCIERLERLLPDHTDHRVEHVGHSDDDAASRGARRRSGRASSACTSSIRRATCTCSRSFRRRRRRKETIDAARRFSDRILGKGIVVAKDVPGFVANRLGVFGMVLAIRLMEKHGLTIDEADVLTGVLTGRSKSATFRTADLSGIDVIAHVTKGLSETTGEDFALSPWVLDLVEGGSRRRKERRRVLQARRQGDSHARLARPASTGRRSKPDDAGAHAPRASCRSPSDSRRSREWADREGDVRQRILIALLPLRADHDAGDRLRHCRRSITRWSGATPGRPVRSSRWTCSASISCAADSPSSGSTSRRCSAK